MRKPTRRPTAPKPKPTRRVTLRATCRAERGREDRYYGTSGVGPHAWPTAQAVGGAKRARSQRSVLVSHKEHSCTAIGVASAWCRMASSSQGPRRRCARRLQQLLQSSCCHSQRCWLRCKHGLKQFARLANARLQVVWSWEQQQPNDTASTCIPGGPGKHEGRGRREDMHSCHA